MWPLVLKALAEQGIADLNTQIAAAATIQIECSGWVPVVERRADKIKQPKLWATQERYWKAGYFGRGILQLSLEENYRACGEAMGIDLLAHPELALEPATAARIFAWYFKTFHVAESAQAGHWATVRMRVNGGNGVDVLAGGTTRDLNKFTAAVRALIAVSSQPAPTPGP